MIFVRNTNLLIPKDEPNLIAGVGVSGWFKLSILKTDLYGKPIEKSERVVADFPNLVLVSGLNRLGSQASGTGNYCSFCQVGTGSNAPLETDTTLQSYLAGVAAATLNSSVQGAPPYYGQSVYTYDFAVGAAAGNLTEVGIGWAASGANLLSRALITDGGGTPITITVLSDEILRVTYTLRLYPNEVDSSTVVTISGTNYTFTRRASDVNISTHWCLSGNSTSTAVALARAGISGNTSVDTLYVTNGSIGAITASPSGSQAFRTSVANSAYVTGSFQTDGSATWGINAANFGGSGITAAVVSAGEVPNLGRGFGRYQFGISPGIPKINTQALTLNLRVSWNRRIL